MSNGSSANISHRARRRLNRLCDRYNLSQAEMLDILLDLHERAELLGMIHFTPAVLQMKPLDGEPEPKMPRAMRTRSRQGGHSSKPYSKQRAAKHEAKAGDAAAEEVE